MMISLIRESTSIKRKIGTSIGTGIRVGLASGASMARSAYDNKAKLVDATKHLGKFSKNVLIKGLSTGKQKYQDIKTSK
ncbi:MAG: hypothetical protein J7L15_01960 [Clostridiales bacterium]|nr:hypothetical protein [Clostridiales bacterium]